MVLLLNVRGTDFHQLSSLIVVTILRVSLCCQEKSRMCPSIQTYTLISIQCGLAGQDIVDCKAHEKTHINNKVIVSSAMLSNPAMSCALGWLLRNQSCQIISSVLVFSY